MNPIGVFNTEYLGMSVTEMARLIREGDMGYVQLDPRVPEVTSGGEKLSSRRAQEVRTILANEGIQIAALAGYTNLVDLNPSARRSGIETLKEMIALCHDYGTSYIATETGSFNPNSPWEDDPFNHTPEGFAQLIEVLQELAETAREHGVTVLIEGATMNVLSTLEQAQRISELFPGEEIGFVLDPFNYFTCTDLLHQQAMFDKAFGVLAKRSPLVHAKDVVCLGETTDTPRAGAGSIDWNTFARMLQASAPNVPLILEHLKRSDIPRSRKVIEAAFETVSK